MAHFDPLALVFGLGASAMIAGMAAPIVFVRSLIWRRRAKSRNRQAACGQCGVSLVEASEGPFLYSGIFVCGACAETLRRRLTIALPALVGVVLVAGVLSAVGFLLGGPLAGGPSLQWWLDGRWIALTLPSVGLGGAGWLILRHSKRRNQLVQRTAPVELSPDQDLAGLIEGGVSDHSVQTVLMLRVSGVPNGDPVAPPLRTP